MKINNGKLFLKVSPNREFCDTAKSIINFNQRPCAYEIQSRLLDCSMFVANFAYVLKKIGEKRKYSVFALEFILV